MIMAMGPTVDILCVILNTYLTKAVKVPELLNVELEPDNKKQKPACIALTAIIIVPSPTQLTPIMELD